MGGYSGRHLSAAPINAETSPLRLKSSWFCGTDGKAEEGAENSPIGEIRGDLAWQGLKPQLMLMALSARLKVVPCYKASRKVFSASCNAESVLRD